MSVEYFVKTICDRKVKPIKYSFDKEIHIFYFIYPIILIVGLILSLFIPNDWKSFYFFSSRNLVNKLFAYKGNIIFTVLYTLLSISRVVSVPLKKQLMISLLPIPNTINVDNEKNNKPKLKVALSQITKFILKNLILYINFFIIDHLFIFTGGNCFVDDEPVTSITDSQVCGKLNGVWKGGFDISGHFCFIVSISLVLFNELKIMIDNYQFKQANKIISTLTLVTLFTWCCVLVVTSVFYHTLVEKILGLSMGYICPLVIYSKIFEKVLI